MNKFTAARESGNMLYTCMECGEHFSDRFALTWVIDNYNIPYKLVCDDCYEKVNNYICHNDYGRYLSQYELYGDEY